MASGTFYDSWGPTNTTTDSSVRYHQNHLKVTWSSDNSQVTYTVNAYARSGNGSGYYYASQYGVTVTIYYSLNNGNWVSLGSASGTLDYNSNVANTGNKTVKINRTTSSQTIKFKAVNTGNSLYSTTTQTGNDTIGALTSYTVSYNANGGSGAPGNQTKYYGQTLTLSSVTPSRSSSTQNGYTVTFKAPDAGYADTSIIAKNIITYTLKDGTSRWNTNNAGTGTGYASGGNYTANAAVTLYAQWNSNTTSGTVNIPTGVNREGYTLLGWDTNSAATTPTIAATVTAYTPDQNKTLYAIWKQNYIPATLTNIKAIRVESSTATAAADEGTVGYITVNWTNGRFNETTQTTPSAMRYSYQTTNGTTTTGTVTLPSNNSTTTSFWIENLNINNSWDITVTLIDNNGSTTNESSKKTLLSPAFYTMDFLRYGHGIAIGGPATLEDTLHCLFKNGITFEGTSDGKWRLWNDNGNLSVEWVSS